MKKEIPADEIGKKNSCLLVGNGINLLFGESAWQDLIVDELKTSHSHLSYEDIREMPATMQIVVATGNKVSTQMKNLSDKLMKVSLSEERIAFLQEILALPTDDILTANYSFELEAADGMKIQKRQYSAKLRNTFDLQSRHKRFRLYQYYETQAGKRIWHVHGDAAKPETMMMGHYYYAKQLSDMQTCIAKAVRRFKIQEKNGEPFQTYSWIDRFLISDVYILGLGMYLCDSDLWYLLCCKKRNFPETKVFFYDKDCDHKDVCMMLQAYGVQLINGEALKVEQSSGSEAYKEFYRKALQDIRRRSGDSDQC